MSWLPPSSNRMGERRLRVKRMPHHRRRPARFGGAVLGWRWHWLGFRRESLVGDDAGLLRLPAPGYGNASFRKPIEENALHRAPLSLPLRKRKGKLPLFAAGWRNPLSPLGAHMLLASPSPCAPASPSPTTDETLALARAYTARRLAVGREHLTSADWAAVAAAAPSKTARQCRHKVEKLRRRLRSSRRRPCPLLDAIDLLDGPSPPPFASRAHSPSPSLSSAELQSNGGKKAQGGGEEDGGRQGDAEDADGDGAEAPRRAAAPHGGLRRNRPLAAAGRGRGSGIGADEEEAEEE
ncbi:hypothetical protein EJB05_35270, partial [Eragrostis curvula]